MKRYIIHATVRTLLGRKVKKLRAQGQIPATVYGKSIKSISLSVSAEELGNVSRLAGETGLIELTIDKEVHHVLIHAMQVHPVTDEVLHVEFHEVSLKEKVHANVPLTLVGESPAVAGKIGVILTIVDSLEVVALPTDLPDHIDVDVSGLTDVNQEVRVSDLTLPSGVTTDVDNTQTVVKVGALVSHAVEVAAEEAAAATQAATLSESEAPTTEGQPAPATPSEKPTEGKEEK